MTSEVLTEPDASLTSALSAKKAKHTWFKPSMVLICLLVVFLLLQWCMPLRTAVQIGADEGMELAKAILCLNGYRLYTDAWNDQPPLHTFLVAALLKHVSPSILGPRLLTTGFSLLLLSAVFIISLRGYGVWVAAVTTILIIGSPGFLQLGSSCMLEIPALGAALVGLCVLVALPPNKWRVKETLCGVILGLALQMKLVPVILLALAPPIIWLRHERRPNRFKATFISLLLLGACLALSFVAVDFLVDSGDYLRHFRQSWTSHFGAAKSLDYGSADDYPFEWALLLKNWDTTIPALLGVALMLRSIRRDGRHILPLSWLALSLTIFAIHRPWWPYYYVHIAIPLCWCAGIGIVTVARWIWLRRRLAPRVVVAACGLVTLGWMSGRLYLQIVEIRHAPQTYSSPVLQQLEGFKPFARWIYADQPIFSFYARIPMPPPLAVVPLKRMWAGEMTNGRIAQEMAHYQPGLVLLANDGRLLPFQDLLDGQYRVVYVDASYRLYARRSIAKKAAR